MDQGENLSKLKRGRSAYKAQLIDNLMEKGTRAKDINARKNRISQMAYLHQASIRSQLDLSKVAFNEIEKANKLDLEKKEFLKKLPKKEDN